MNIFTLNYRFIKTFGDPYKEKGYPLVNMHKLWEENSSIFFHVMFEIPTLDFHLINTDSNKFIL